MYTKRPNPIHRSVSAYHALLGLYPAEHRREYGPLMLQAFHDLARDAYLRGGNTGLLALWASTLADLARTALEERIHKGITMNKDSFIRLSGLAATLGGAIYLWAIITTATLPLPLFGHRDTSDSIPFMLAGLALMIVGLAGLGARGRLAGRWTGTLVTTVGALGVANFAVTLFGLLPWEAAMLGYYALLAAFLTAGVAMLRSDPGLAVLLIVGAVAQGFFNTEDHRAWLGIALGVAWLAIGARQYRRGDRPLPSAA